MKCFKANLNAKDCLGLAGIMTSVAQKPCIPRSATCPPGKASAFLCCNGKTTANGPCVKADHASLAPVGRLAGWLSAHYILAKLHWGLQTWPSCMVQ